MKRILLVYVCFCIGHPAGFSEESATTPSSARASIDATFRKELTKLQSQVSSDAIERIYPYSDKSRIYVCVADAVADDSLPIDEALAPRLHKLRKQYAAELLKIAVASLDAGNSAAAYQAFCHVNFHDPARKKVRIVVPSKRSSENIQVRPARSVNAKLNWPAGSYLTARSENYLVTSNASREQTLKLIAELELLNDVWRQLFFEHWSTIGALKRAWAGKGSLPKNRDLHRVVLFSNRKEYVDYLQQIEPQARMTLGYYSTHQRTAYFFVRNDQNAKATWRHEATHQLFQETRRVRTDVGMRENFWIIEGLALYLESLQPIGSYYSTGGLEAERLQFARYRALCENAYVPLAKFVGFGRTAIQSDPDIRKLYSQAAGLTHFFMHAHDGQYRTRFLKYVAAVYRGRDSHATLETIIGKSYAELDDEYRQFLRLSDQDLLELDPRVSARNLAIGCTDVTDRGVENLRLDQVRWMDFMQTRVTDNGLKRIGEARDLRQLSLVGCDVSDATIARLRELKHLEELDIRNTKVSDASIKVLSELKALNVFECEGSRISPSGRMAILDALPNLR